MDVRQRTEEIERLTLASWATFSDASRGRVRPEEQDPIRPVFQRDRDRIITARRSGGSSRKRRYFSRRRAISTAPGSPTRWRWRRSPAPLPAPCVSTRI